MDTKAQQGRQGSNVSGGIEAEPDPIVTLSGGGVCCSVARKGAELLSLRTADGSELLWDGDPQWWNQRSPNLFPIIGHPHDGHVVYDGRRYPMPLHGIAHSSTFEVVERRGDYCLLELRDDMESRRSFPFSFVLTVAYAIRRAHLYVQATIRNPSPRVIPIAFGFHPGFALPGARMEDHQLDFGPHAPGLPLRSRAALLDESETPAKLTIADRDFVSGAMIFAPYQGGSPTLVCRSKPIVRLQPHNLGVMAIWRRPEARFICIEPWSSVPVSLFERDEDLCASPRIDHLPGGGERTFGMVIDTAPLSTPELWPFPREGSTADDRIMGGRDV